LIGDIRGKGLMIGFELVSDRDKKTPGTVEAKKFMEICKDNGLLLGLGGLLANVIRIQPPLVLTMDQIDQSLEIMDDAFRAMEG